MQEAEKKQSGRIRRILPLIFAVAIILICGLVFIFNYSSAYNNDSGAGFIPPSFGVIYYFFLIALAFIIAAILLKVTLRKRVNIGTLLLSAVLLPILCYLFNYHSLGENGFLHFLVDDGGVLNFVVIGDYDFDGMNDEYHHILYDEREYSSRYGGHFDDTIIDYIDTTAVGTGAALSGCHCSYDWEEKVIKLYLAEGNVKLKQIKITVAFQDPSMAEKVSFYLGDTELEHTLNEGNTVSIVFDAVSSSKLQNSIDRNHRYIPIKYVLN